MTIMMNMNFFANAIGVKPLSIYDGFYKHKRELLNNLGFKSLYDYYDAIRKSGSKR
jgi:hypothetical protein